MRYIRRRARGDGDGDDGDYDSEDDNRDEDDNDNVADDDMHDSGYEALHQQDRQYQPSPRQEPHNSNHGGIGGMPIAESSNQYGQRIEAVEKKQNDRWNEFVTWKNDVLPGYIDKGYRLGTRNIHRNSNNHNRDRRILHSLIS